MTSTGMADFLWRERVRDAAVPDDAPVMATDGPATEGLATDGPTAGVAVAWTSVCGVATDGNGAPLSGADDRCGRRRSLHGDRLRGRGGRGRFRADLGLEDLVVGGLFFRVE